MTDPDNQLDVQSVIAKAYAAVAEPEQFVSLMPLLVETSEHSDFSHGGADEHFENTLRILDKLYPLKTTNFNAIQTEAGAVMDCDLALDSELRIAYFNARTFAEYDLKFGAFLPEALFNPVTEKADLALLRGMEASAEPHFLKLFSGGPSKAPRWFAARRIEDEDTSQIVLTAVKLRWDEASSDLFARAFSMTPTELALTRHLVIGGSVREFSEIRERSLGTVRNQLKALQRKLEINSKEELLLLYAGFIHSLNPVGAADDDALSLNTNIFNIAQGAVIAWEQCGDPSGDPVLYFHPLEGPMLPKRVHKAAMEHGLRIIAPWRPGLGDSSPAKTGPDAPEVHAERLAALLDVLEIKSAVGLAMQAGMPFMIGMANALPDRLSAGIGAGAFFPFSQREDFQHLKTQPRIHIRTSRIAPAFARAYIRAMLASLGNGQFYRFVEDFYKDCERELETARDPEIVALFRHAARYGLSPGSTGMLDTMMNWSHDWGDELAKCDLPLHLLHGERDGTTPLDFVETTCARYGLNAPVIVPGGGSFLLYDEAAAVTQYIRKLLDGTR